MRSAPLDAGRSTSGAEDIAPHVLTAFRKVAAAAATDLNTVNPVRRTAALHLLDELHGQFSVQAPGAPA